MHGGSGSGTLYPDDDDDEPLLDVFSGGGTYVEPLLLDELLDELAVPLSNGALCVHAIRTSPNANDVPPIARMRSG